VTHTPQWCNRRKELKEVTLLSAANLCVPAQDCCVTYIIDLELIENSSRTNCTSTIAKPQLGHSNPNCAPAPYCNTLPQSKLHPMSLTDDAR